MELCTAKLSSEPMDTFNQTTLVKTPTCFKTARETFLDVLLTNKSNSLQKTGACETGLSDSYKMVFTISSQSLEKNLD